MDNSPLITVYITNYNYAKYIRESVESVLKQTLQSFEILIIDDGSTDNSRDIIEEYRNNPKVSIIYQQNKGLNVTNNIAMRAASGTYLMRLDADDFLEPNALEVMSSTLESDPELGLVFPDYYYIDAIGNKIGEEKRHDFNKEVSLYDQPAHGACTMIRLEFLKKLGGYNESFTCQDGYDLWIKFITHHKVTNVSKQLFSYRQHGNNLTTNEERILNTRKKIKEVFVEEHFTIPDTIAVIPVRNTFIKEVNWPLYSAEGSKSILEEKVHTCLNAKNIKATIISCSDKEIYEFAKNKFEEVDNVYVLERPKAFAAPNVTLFKTLEHAYHFAKDEKGIDAKAIVSLSLEYPFLNADVIDDAVNTLVLFSSDSVISVRPDNKMYYQHIGHGMIPILDQEKFTKLEREAIYKGAGGVVASTIEHFLKDEKMVSGKVSHIVVDQKTAFSVSSLFEFKVFELIAKDTVYA